VADLQSTISFFAIGVNGVTAQSNDPPGPDGDGLSDTSTGSEADFPSNEDDGAGGVGVEEPSSTGPAHDATDQATVPATRNLARQLAMGQTGTRN
jgi:hypothetical protein